MVLAVKAQLSVSPVYFTVGSSKASAGAEAIMEVSITACKPGALTMAVGLAPA